MKTLKLITFPLLSLIVLAVVFLFSPELVLAQDAGAGAKGGFVPCSGSECTFCHFIQLGNNILNWLFGIVFVIFGVIMVVAGFNLVTSGGNRSKLDDAKQKLSNALIGVLIMFSAWLLVDTLLKAALPTDSGGNAVVQLGQRNFGPWNQISCAGGQRQYEPVAPGAASGGGGGGTNGGGTSGSGDCLDCVSYGANEGLDLGNGNTMPFNANPCNGETTCYVNGVMVNRLSGMGDETEGWQISEAWPPYGYTESDPSGIHASSCHGTATCIDVSFVDRNSQPTNAEILAFQNAARANGLTVVYESSDSQRVADLRAAGIQAATVNVNREHFSVYMCDVDSSPLVCGG